MNNINANIGTTNIRSIGTSNSVDTLNSVQIRATQALNLIDDMAESFSTETLTAASGTIDSLNSDSITTDSLSATTFATESLTSDSIANSGTASIGGVLTVSSATQSTTTTNGCAVFSGGLGIAKNVNIAGIVYVSDSTNSTTINNGCMILDGGIGVEKNATVGGVVKVTDTTESTSTTTGSGIFAGGVGVAKNVNVAGTLNVDDTTVSTSTSTGCATFDGGVGIVGTATIGSAHTVDLTQSTSVSTGSVIVDGGMGVARNLHAGAIYHAGGLLVPTGSIIAYAVNVAPNGWLLCDGSAVNRTTYAALFAAIGSTFGDGDHSTTFNIPDMRTRTPIGYNGSFTFGSSGGNSSLNIEIENLPAHTHTGTTNGGGAHNHTITDPGHVHPITNGRGNADFSNQPGEQAIGDCDPDDGVPENHVLGAGTNSATTGISLAAASNHTHTFETDATGSSVALNMMNPYIAMSYIIKY